MVVNYRGPEILKRISQQFGISVFNRVTELRFNLVQPAEFVLEPQMVTPMNYLETISITGTSGKDVKETINASIPPCRLKSVEQNSNSINAELTHGDSAFLCGCKSNK